MIASRWFSSKKKSTGIEIHGSDLRVASLVNPSAKANAPYRFECTTVSSESSVPSTITTQYTNLVLPQSNVSMNYIEVPKVPDRELHRMVGYELAKHIDMPVRDVTYDYTHSGFKSTKDSNNRLITFSCPKPIVEAALEKLDAIKIIPKSLDSTVTALLNLVLAIEPKTQSQSCIAVCEHDDYALILILTNGELVFSRSIPRFQVEDDDPLAELKDPTDDLAQELIRTVEYSNMHFPGFTPEHFFTLGSMDHERLHDLIHDATSIPCERIRTTTRLQIIDDTLADEQSICDYAVAMGGALRLALHGA